MNETQDRTAGLRGWVRALTTLHIILSAIGLIVVPLLGWLAYGRADWLISRLPHWLLNQSLPAAFYFYWNFGFAISAPALLCAMLYWRRTQTARARRWLLVNTLLLLAYVVLRLVILFAGVQMDSV